MPAPSSANSLSLGAPVVDATTIDTMDDVRANFYKMQEFFVGAGYPCGYAGTGMVVLNVYAEDDGEGGHLLWGGNPTDPLSPIPIIVSASGSATVIWQEEGSTVKTSGTVNFVGAGVTVTDEGDGKATVTIPGGGGGGGTYTEGDGIDIDGSNVVSAELATNRGLEFDGSGIAVSIGDGLEMSTNDIVVKAHTYIDVSPSGVAVDFTEVASYNGAGDQYLRNNSGTFQWATLPSGSAPTAGTYIDVSGTTVSVDLTEVSGWAVVTGEYQGLVHDGSGTILWMDATICNPVP